MLRRIPRYVILAGPVAAVLLGMLFSVQDSQADSLPPSFVIFRGDDKVEVEAPSGFDPLGGEVGERSTKCIAREGRILIIGFTSGAFPTFRANHMLVKNYSVLGLYVRYTNAWAKERCWGELLGLYERGAVTPHVSKRYPMEKAGEAMAYLASRRAVGKIVLYW